MSIRIMSAVFENEALGPTERLILLALADHADDEGRCYPSISRLCKRTGLAERSVQSNIRKLQDQGYVTVNVGAGQGGANVYFIRATPAADAPPQQMHPRAKCTTPPQEVRPTPAADAPKPSRTIIEPSVVKKERDEVSETLCAFASSEAVASFIEFRKRVKRDPLTLTGAKRLAGHLQEILNAGHDPSDALGLAEERGWKSVKPDWYFKDKEQQNDHRSQNHSAGPGSAGGRRGPHHSLMAGFAAVANRDG